MGPLLSTHVTGGQNHRYPDRTYTFRADVGEGEYLIGIIMGKLTERPATTINKPPFWFRSYKIGINGEEVYSREYDLDEYLSWWYSASEDDFLPGDSMYEKYVERYFPVRTYRVAANGAIELELSAVCPINALLIYPAGKEREFRAKIEEIRNLSRETIDEGFIERRSEEELSAGLRKEHEGRGYILFTRPREEITPYSRPKKAEAGRPAGVFITPGDLARADFSILPLKELKGVNVEISDLVSADGRIPGGSVEVWLERYYTLPAVRTGSIYSIRPWYALEYGGGMDFRAEVARTFNLYFRVPGDAPAGDYEGTVRLSFKNAPAAEQSVRVKVLPFTLDEPDTLFGGRTNHPENTSLRFVPRNEPGLREKSNKLLKVIYEEMREMGFTNAITEMPWHPFRIGEDGEIVDAAEGRARVAEAPVTTWELWEDALRTCAGIFGDKPIILFGSGWASLVSPSTAPGFWGRQVDEWEKHGYTEEAIANAEKIVEHFYGRGKEMDVPEVIFHMSDELSNYGLRGGRLGAEVASIYRRMADRIGFRIIATMNGPAEHGMLPYLDIAALNMAFNRPEPLTEELLDKIRDAGCDLWFFNIGGNRFSHGYYVARTGAKGRYQYGYMQKHRYVSQIPFLPSLGRLQHTFILDSDLNHGRRYDVEDMRQGVVDYKYFRTLERLVEERRGKADARAISNAERVIKSIMDGVKVDGLMEPWSPNVCERLRWRMATAIMEVAE